MESRQRIHWIRQPIVAKCEGVPGMGTLSLQEVFWELGEGCMFSKKYADYPCPLPLPSPPLPSLYRLFYTVQPVQGTVARGTKNLLAGM